MKANIKFALYSLMSKVTEQRYRDRHMPNSCVKVFFIEQQQCMYCRRSDFVSAQLLKRPKSGRQVWASTTEGLPQRILIEIKQASEN